MNKRVQIILFSAFLLSALCGYLVYRMVGSRVAASQQPRTRAVVIAAGDIEAGGVLKNSDLGTMRIEGTLPDGAMTDPRQAVGRGVVSQIYKGEPIMESRLASPGAGGGLAAMIPVGMRACAVRVDEVVGVAGFAVPGMRVDVLIAGVPPGANNGMAGPKVRTLLQNIEVLSAGTDIQKDGEARPQSAQVVNLLVTPQQAEELSLAGSQTHIQLVLRNPLDTQIAQTNGTAVVNLYGETSQPAATKPSVVTTNHGLPAKPRGQAYVVQVYNGSKQSEQKFTSGEDMQ